MRLTRCHPPLPLLRALEAYFGCEVTAASFYEADPTLGRAPLSWAKGDRVVLPRGLFAPLRPEGVFLLAHEVCHLRQQAEHASLKPRDAEREANDHAAVFTLRYLGGQLRPGERPLLPLAKAASVPALAWGLGGLFSLKQLLTDGYAKHKGYAYFYKGPHEWLTETAAKEIQPYLRNYTTRRYASVDWNYSLVLGSEMNDMYILPELLKDWFDTEVLDAIGKAAEASDFTSVEEYAPAKKVVKAAQNKNAPEALIALLDRPEANIPVKSDLDLSFSIMMSLLEVSFRSIRFFSLLKEKKEEIDKKINEIILKDQISKTISDYKMSALDAILKVLPDNHPISNLLQFSFISFLTNRDESEYFTGLLKSFVERKLFDNDVDQAVLDELEKRKSQIRRKLNAGEENLVDALVLVDLWWKTESVGIRNLESNIARLLRSLPVLLDQTIQNVKQTRIGLADFLSDFLNSLNFDDLPNETLVRIPWITCERSDYFLPNCTVTERDCTVDLTALKGHGRTIRQLVFDPILESENALIQDYIVPLLAGFGEYLDLLTTFYNTGIFLLGSHTGELQYLHSMDCSRGSTEWNRKKMIRWCKFCFECNILKREKMLLDENIFSYFDRWLPPLTEPVRKDRLNILTATELDQWVSENLERYQAHFKDKEDELLLASMLLPLCCIRTQMNNCQLAAKNITGLQEDNALSMEQARNFDLCLLIGLKRSLWYDEETAQNGSRFQFLPGRYRTPISDMTFREFFTAKRSALSAPDILIGMAMHMIEDSFTPSHTIRAWNCKPGEGVAPIITFADYTKQDASRHACADYFVDAPAPLSLEKTGEPDPMDVDDPRGDGMSVDLDGASPKASQRTAEDRMGDLPREAAAVTVGAECARFYAAQFYAYTKPSTSEYSQFDPIIVKNIYPLLGERSEITGNGEQRIVKLGEVEVDLSDMETPPSGRCFEMEALEKETVYEEKVNAIVRSTIRDMLEEKRDSRLDELNEAVSNYRKYLLKHFAPNRYPAPEDLSYYEKEAAQNKRMGFSEWLEKVPERWNEFHFEGEKKPISDPSRLSKNYHPAMVLEMYVRNDIPYLLDILSSPLLRKKVVDHYGFPDGANASAADGENETALSGSEGGGEKRGPSRSDTAEALAEDFRKTHERYIRHLNELILNAVGIWEQSNDTYLRQRAKDTVKEALWAKSTARRLWENGEEAIVIHEVETYLNSVKDRVQRAEIFLRILLDGLDVETIQALLLQCLRSENPEEFQQNALDLLEALEEMLEGSSSGRTVLEAIQELRKKYELLTPSVDAETIRQSAEPFCSELAQLLRQLPIEDYPELQGIKLPSNLNDLLALQKDSVIDLLDSLLNDVFNIAAMLNAGKMLPDSAELFERYLSEALDQKKQGVPISDFVGEGGSGAALQESLSAIGGSLLKALNMQEPTEEGGA